MEQITTNISSYEKFILLQRAIKRSIPATAEVKQRMKMVSNSAGCMFVVKYNAQNRIGVVSGIIDLYSFICAHGTLKSVTLRDSLDRVERNETLHQSSTNITHCQTFDSVEDISPITHGDLFIEVSF